MKREIVASATTLAQSTNASRDRIPGRVVLFFRTVGRFTAKIVSIIFIFATAAAFGYTKLDSKTLQTNGSASDTQAAINAAPDGAAIVIPNGAYSWNQQVTNSRKNWIRLLAQSAGGVTITRGYTGGDLLVLYASANGNVELGGINFTSNFTGSNDNFSCTLTVNPAGGRPPLIHDCSFVTGYEYAVHFAANGGVMWKCSFATHSDGLGGITFVNTPDGAAPWNQPTSMGQQGDPNGTLNTYIEDCTFRDATIAMSNFDDNSRVAWRHCLMSNSALGSHGQETSIWGCRHWEIYDNTFVYSTSGSAFGGDPYPLNLNYWFSVRGGTGVVTGNAIPAIPGKAQIQLNVFSINRSDSIPCQTAYPAARQVGQSWSASSSAPYGHPIVSKDGVGAVTDPVYVWGNSGTATTNLGFVALNQYAPDDCHNGQVISNYLRLGRDYNVGTGRPNWTRFTYPHPLRGSGSTGPQNLRIVQ